jgi:hypothetical protein
MLKSIRGLSGWCRKDCSAIYRLWRQRICETKWIGWWPKIYTNNWTWRQIIKSLEDNLENGEEYVGLTETPYQNLMLDKLILRTKEWPIGHRLFLPQEVVWRKYGMGVFREGTIIDNDFHIERWSQLFTQMSGCNIFLNHNLWFKVEKIKMK